MKFGMMFSLCGFALVAAGLAEARPGPLQARIQARAAETDDADGRADNTGTRIGYGADAAQRVLVWPATSRAGAARPPLAVFVHGGGWSKGMPEMVDAKPGWFRGHGWAFASIGYRLLPDIPVEDQARDIGRALGELRRQAARLGYDPDRILVFGHSAGAHLAALLSTDPGYAAESFAAIKATILIDGACYDVPSQIAASPVMARRIYIPAFGIDPVRQRALSPISHVGGDDVADWLILNAGARADSRGQSQALAAALRQSGSSAETLEIPSRSRNPLAGHLEANRDFGTPGYAANAEVEAIMQRVER